MARTTAVERIEGVMDPYRSFIEAVPRMVGFARVAANELASSYRNFNVGSALYLFYPELNRAELFHAGNTKREGQEKVCAEQKVLGQAARSAEKLSIRTGHPVQQEVAGLVIAGTTEIDEIEAVTQLRTPTLWSCQTCISDYDVNPSVSEDTLLVMTGRRVRGDDERYQVFSVGQMRRLYLGKTTEVDSQQTQYGFDSPAWQQRVARYDALMAAEAVLPVGEQRASSQLAQLAMLSALPS